jgi:TetR/AcrR family transcriptional regulator
MINGFSERGRVAMTLAERRQREKNQRRDSIIDAASKLFFSKGYKKVSMDEIASEAELSKAMIYTYFKDKEALFFAVVNRGIKFLRAMIKEEIEKEQTSGIKIGAINSACIRFIQGHPDYARAYIYYRSGKFEFSTDIGMSIDAKEVLEFNEEYFEIVFSIIKVGIEDRTFRSDINPVVVTILNVIIGECILNPDLGEMLKAHGITMKQFHKEVTDLQNNMIINTE